VSGESPDRGKTSFPASFEPPDGPDQRPVMVRMARSILFLPLDLRSGAQAPTRPGLDHPCPSSAT
jgi:hypothetical protein